MNPESTATGVTRKANASEVAVQKRSSRAVEAKFNRIGAELRSRPARPERSIARSTGIEEREVAKARLLRDEFQTGVLDDIGAAIGRFFEREDAAKRQLRADLMNDIRTLQLDRWQEAIEEFAEGAAA